MKNSASITKVDIDREIALTCSILRRHGIPANHDDAALFVARAHERQSIDDLLRRIATGKDVRPWQVGYVSNVVRREFCVKTPVLREAVDELHAAIHPAHSTVAALRSNIQADPARGEVRLTDLPETGNLRRKLPLLEAKGIETLGIFAARAHQIAPVWTNAVLASLGKVVTNGDAT